MRKEILEPCFINPVHLTANGAVRVDVGSRDVHYSDDWPIAEAPGKATTNFIWNEELGTWDDSIDKVNIDTKEEEPIYCRHREFAKIIDK